MSRDLIGHLTPPKEKNSNMEYIYIYIYIYIFIATYINIYLSEMFSLPINPYLLARPVNSEDPQALNPQKPFTTTQKALRTLKILKNLKNPHPAPKSPFKSPEFKKPSNPPQKPSPPPPSPPKEKKITANHNLTFPGHAESGRR